MIDLKAVTDEYQKRSLLAKNISDRFYVIGMAAVDDGMGLSKNGKMVWRHEEDLEDFWWHVGGQAVVAGQGTIDDIGHLLEENGCKVYPFTSEGLDKLFKTDQSYNDFLDEDTVFVIGGSNVYKAFIPYMDRMRLTFINGHHGCDHLFPMKELCKYLQPEWVTAKYEDGAIQVTWEKRG